MDIPDLADFKETARLVDIPDRLLQKSGRYMLVQLVRYLDQVLNKCWY